MQARRDFLQMAMAATAISGASGLAPWARLAAQDRYDQDALLDFDPLGNVTLMHVSDIHAQLKPTYLRPPEVNIGLGETQGKAPYVTGEALRIRYGVGGGTPMDYALTSENFATLAQAYGKMGGLAQVAAILDAIRAERPDALFLDGGDTWAGSMTSLKTQGQDIVTVMNALGPDAMTAFGEFAYGTDRLRELVAELPFVALGQNIFDTQLHAPAAPFKPHAFFERGGVKIGVIGQAYPFTEALLPAALTSGFAFGLRLANMQRMVEDLRASGAELVVCLSQNGFEIDAKMAAEVEGIDVILSGHSGYALPEPVIVGQTHIIASGSHGHFVSRVDLDVQNGKVLGLRHKLIPVFAELITPDPAVAGLIDAVRAPFKKDLEEILGTAEVLLYRRGVANSTWDDLICTALLATQDAQIALSPGFRWGPSVLPGQPVTREDIYNVTAVANPEVIRTEMTGAVLKDLLETAADLAFNPDPYLRQGADMLRVGGLNFRLEVGKPKGRRIGALTLLPSKTAIEPAQIYVVAGWAVDIKGTAGPPIWEVLEGHIRALGQVGTATSGTVDLVLAE
ncbi:MAG: thiosulfohydrolase SoxB [Sulfitobacter sp.]